MALKVSIALGLLMHATLAEELITIGDSITAGAVSSIPSRAWPFLMAGRRGLDLRNLSYGSAGVSDYSRQAYGAFSNAFFGTTTPESVNRGMSFALLAGYNDMRDWGTNATFLKHFERTLNAVVGWTAIPTESKIFGTDPGVVKIGAWQVSTNFHTPARSFGIESTEIGAQAEWTLKGSTLFICCLSRARPAFPYVPGQSGLPYSRGGAFQLLVDGQPVTVISCFDGIGNRKAINGSDDLIPEAIDQSPHLFRIASLANSDHRVRLTVVSNETPATLIWAAGSDVFQNRPTLPTVSVGTTLRMTPEAYSGHSFRGSDLAVDAFNGVILDVCSKWFDDGASVTAVEMDGFYNPATDLSEDFVHPTDRGHSAIADAFTSHNHYRIRFSRVAGDAFPIEVLGEPGALLILEESAELTTWNSVGTKFSALPGITKLHGPALNQTPFYRIHALP